MELEPGCVDMRPRKRVTFHVLTWFSMHTVERGGEGGEGRGGEGMEGRGEEGRGGEGRGGGRGSGGEGRGGEW